MTAPDEPPLPATEPIGDLLLAQALEACLEAERDHPGSSATVIARAPATARAELRRLMRTVRLLESVAADADPSDAFRAAARKRLLRRIGGNEAAHARHGGLPLRIGAERLAPLSAAGRRARSHWLARAILSLAIVLVGASATLSATASALPGDGLYGVKQAQEELSLRLAADDDDRVLALLRRADARLYETERLLELGRAPEAIQAAERFDAVVERATATLVVTLDFTQVEPARTEELETKLDEQQERLQNMLQAAPEPARANLREALAVTERGRQLVAEPRAPEQSLVRRTARPSPVVAAPRAQAEEQPTVVPTPRPTAAATTTAQATQPADREDNQRSDEREPPTSAEVDRPSRVADTTQDRRPRAPVAEDSATDRPAGDVAGSDHDDGERRGAPEVATAVATRSRTADRAEQRAPTSSASDARHEGRGAAEETDRDAPAEAVAQRGQAEADSSRSRPTEVPTTRNEASNAQSGSFDASRDDRAASGRGGESRPPDERARERTAPSSSGERPATPTVARPAVAAASDARSSSDAGSSERNSGRESSGQERSASSSASRDEPEDGHARQQQATSRTSSEHGPRAAAATTRAGSRPAEKTETPTARRVTPQATNAPRR